MDLIFVMPNEDDDFRNWLTVTSRTREQKQYECVGGPWDSYNHVDELLASAGMSPGASNFFALPTPNEVWEARNKKDEEGRSEVYLRSPDQVLYLYRKLTMDGLTRYYYQRRILRRDFPKVTHGMGAYRWFSS